jgi:hypothetical protein
MSSEAIDDEPNACSASRISCTREALMVAMLMYGLASGGETFAAELSGDIARDLQPMVGGKPMPKAFAPSFATNDFETPVPDFRKFDGLATPSAQAESAIQSKPSQDTAWQRLADFRAQGRVQLLTLWQSPRYMVSLQSGRHGSPSLQWSSRIMNRGGATRGILDRIVASSLGATGLRSKIVAHGAEPAPAIKATGAP